MSNLVDLFGQPRRRDPGPPPMVDMNGKPRGQKGFKERLAELRAGGMSQDEAIMTAADEGVINPRLAEKMLGAMTGVDAAVQSITQDEPEQAPPGYWDDATVPGASPEEAAAIKEQILQQQLAADPEMSQPPAEARSFPPSGPPGSGIPGPAVAGVYPPSGPAPIYPPSGPPGQQIDPRMLMALIQQMRRR